MDNIKMLTIAQQSEVNAVLLYKSLSSFVKNDNDKKLILSIAADEGRHAAELKKITNITLKPKKTLSNLALLSYKLFGKKITFFILAKTEIAAAKVYISLSDNNAQLKQFSVDEQRHGKALINLIK